MSHCYHIVLNRPTARSDTCACGGLINNATAVDSRLQIIGKRRQYVCTVSSLCYSLSPFVHDLYAVFPVYLIAVALRVERSTSDREVAGSIPARALLAQQP